MKPVPVAFLWHMHQPTYRLRGEKVCFMPWVRLHAIRSYYDMVRVLDEFPGVRVTMNLVPSMVEQLKAYEAGGSDLFYEYGVHAPDNLDETTRGFLTEHFFSAQHERMIAPLPAYAKLLYRREQARHAAGLTDSWKEFSVADYMDLIALFNLAWFGFKAREDYPELERLRRKGAGFTAEEVRSIHRIQKEVMARILPLCREAQRRGQLEIACSPYAHPILPLLANSDSAREAMPGAPLPEPFRHPEDVTRQVTDALDLMERELGLRPKGLWPSEGSVSQEAAERIAACGIQWIASDEGNLARSKRDGKTDPFELWSVENTPATFTAVFRDRDLSDRIGFNYAKMEPGEAVHGLLQAALDRTRSTEREPGIVLIALDGENPWEHYADAGGPFLRTLYGQLSRNGALRSVTVGEAVAASPARRRIQRLHAGSWINSDFGIWIGGTEKNRAWGLLGKVRAELDPVLTGEAPAEVKQAVWASLRAAEGSDWFWWLDGQFSSSYRRQFDELFRGHLRQAYEAAGLSPPEFLTWYIPAAEVVREGAVGEPFEAVSPQVDGFEGDIFEWYGALVIPWRSVSGAGAMQRSVKPLDGLRIGFSNAGDFCFRIDPGRRKEDCPFERLSLELSFRTGDEVRNLLVELDENGDLRSSALVVRIPGGDPQTQRHVPVRSAARKILELVAPGEDLGLLPGRPLTLIVKLRTATGEIPLREIPLVVPRFLGAGGGGGMP